jgi:[acyl-carrier-protein] S-malonyltransferase
MGLEACKSSPAARALFEKADQILGVSLMRITQEGPSEELTRTEYAQPAIFVTSLAVLAAREAAGQFQRESFAAAAGLSLGEYTAHCFAGTFSFEAGLRLVRARGLAMQAAAEAQPSGMTSLVGADAATAERVCARARGDGVLVVANLNAPGQVVVSGDLAALARVPEAAKEEGIRRCIPLVVAGAFHSPLMAPASSALATALAGTEMHSPKFPVWSNVTAAPVQDVDSIRALLARQVVEPVRWEETMRALEAAGCTEACEPPPGRVLAALARKCAPSITVSAITEGDG